MGSEGTSPESRETEATVAEEDLELAIRVGSTLASIGDSLDNTHRRRRQTENVSIEVINNLTRTLMAILFFEHCNTLH